jgi:hypothetical protein
MVQRVSLFVSFLDARAKKNLRSFFIFFEKTEKTYNLRAKKYRMNEFGQLFETCHFERSRKISTLNT